MPAVNHPLLPRIKYLEMVQEGQETKAQDLLLKLGSAKRRLAKRVEGHHQKFVQLIPLLAAVDLTSRKGVDDHILLPSSFTSAERKVLGMDQLVEIEGSLRVGQGHDVLEKIRRALSLRSFLSRHSKAANVSGSTTRSVE